MTALRTTVAAELTQGAVALKAEVDAEHAHDHRAELMQQRAAAKAKGYEGEACPECMNFTMVRNGTCLKCDTCGSTTGCSANLVRPGTRSNFSQRVQGSSPCAPHYLSRLSLIC